MNTPIQIINVPMLKAMWGYLTNEQRQSFVDNELTDETLSIIAAIDEELAFNISLYGRGGKYSGRANAKRTFVADSDNNGSFETIISEEPELTLELEPDEVRTIIGVAVQLYPGKFIPFMTQAFGGKLPSIKPAEGPAQVGNNEPQNTGIIEGNEPQDL